MTRRAARLDANQHAIIAALRARGVWCHSTASQGFGYPDAITWWRGEWRLLEIKSEDGNLTDWELAFAEHCPGEIHVVRSVADALRAHGIEEA